ncbi:hypothetical protein AALO_G00022390 [Alosa alosa]|uniref:C-type lectin domain-containing protein n=1 Tax=Alosa alosa TaxID=278164 RepID=A0AAV6HDV9_9TELE|nr:asialoglycoprotein receptor 1-like [Alosa alosa]KAG5284046.1 hypothetical protein AALO_G00022390 [Alosa alosa]
MIMANLQSSLDTTVLYSNTDEENGRLKWWKGATLNPVTPCIGHRRLQLFFIISVTIILFLILVVMVPIKFNQQDEMLKELETKADNMALTLNSLPYKLQQKAPHSQEPALKELTEMKSSLTNLRASITSLSSEQHKTADQQNRILTELDLSVTDLSQSLKAASLNTQPSNVHNTEKEDSKIAQMNLDIVDVSHSVNALSTDFHETVKLQESTLNELKAKADNISSFLYSIPSKLQETSGEEKITALNNLTTQILSSIRQMINDDPKSKCPEDWDFFLANCYLFSQKKLSWHDARDSCKSQGASLLTVTKRNEWPYVTKNTMSRNYWIGLTDEITGTWRWVDETPYVMDKRQWRENQPDNWTDHAFGGPEDCAHLSWNGKLNDAHCAQMFTYICKKAAPIS